MINQPTMRMIQRRKELLGRRGLKKQERDCAIDKEALALSILEVGRLETVEELKEFTI